MSGAETDLSEQKKKLLKTFNRFRERLHHIDTKQPSDWKDVRSAFFAMHAALQYSVVVVMPPSYGLYGDKPIVEMPKTRPDNFRRMLFSSSGQEVRELWDFMYDLRQ